MNLADAIKNVENETITENGMVAFKSTMDSIVDLFYKAPQLRATPSAIASLVEDAINDSKEDTLRILYYLRDIRGGSVGQGERAIFREGLSAFIKKVGAKECIENDILKYIPEYGRWDDLLHFINIDKALTDYIFNIIFTQLKADVAYWRSKEYTKVSLLAKWLPSASAGRKKDINGKKRLKSPAAEAKKAFVKAFRKWSKISEKQYRKTLTALRSTINLLETKLTTKTYDFDYSKLPSKARLKHSGSNGAFIRNDNNRFQQFVADVAEGKVKVNTSTIYPYEIVSRIHDLVYRTDPSATLPRESLNNDWNNLPNWLAETNAKFLPIIDTSGSMTQSRNWNDPIKPIHVALGIGIYMAERLPGAFKNTFITFSEKPVLQVIPEGKLSDKIKSLKEINCWNTDLERSFDLILNAAKRYDVPQEEMPTHILIISDMQFDQASNGKFTAMKMIRNKYAIAGYTAPSIVFWNAADSSANTPVKFDEHGTVLVSGKKPGLLEEIVRSNTPEDMVREIVNHARYNVITFK